MLIQFSRATIFALCMSQAAVAFTVVLFYPQVRVETFTAHPTVVNGSLIANTENHIIKSTSFSLPFPFIILSCIAALFSTTTISLIQQSAFSLESPYTYETLSETGLWDLTFWSYCLGAHVLVLLISLSPGDIYSTSLASILTVYFLAHACQPRSGNSVSMIQGNFNLLGYFSGILIALYSIPDSHPGRSAAIAVTVLLDYVLAVGHTFDHEPSMDVITNCRIFWACSSSFCLSGLYGAWHDSLLMD